MYGELTLALIQQELCKLLCEPFSDDMGCVEILKVNNKRFSSLLSGSWVQTETTLGNHPPFPHLVPIQTQTTQHT